MGQADSNDRGRKPRKIWYYYAIVWLVVLVFNLMIMPKVMSHRVITATYTDFMDALEADEVKQVQFSSTEINYTIETVSYTHLDVYKRQVFKSAHTAKATAPDAPSKNLSLIHI